MTTLDAIAVCVLCLGLLAGLIWWSENDERRRHDCRILNGEYVEGICFAKGTVLKP